MTKQIKIKLLPNGLVEMETHGIKGKKCLDYIEFFEKLTDTKIQKQELTSEYYEEENEYIQDNSQAQQNLYE